jgi:aminoglycoside 2''-phosphotransferase
MKRKYNSEDIKQMLITQFQDLIVDEIEYLNSGNDSEAYLINDAIVFKVPKHQRASDNLVREKKVLDLIQNRVSLQVPKVAYSSTLSNGFILLGYDKLEGKTLSKEEFNQLTEEQQSNVAKQIAIFLGELHQIKIMDDELIVDKQELLRIDYQEFIVSFSKHLTSEQLERTRHFLEQVINDKSLYNYKPTLVHNDFSANNILFDDETKTISAVLDFGDVAITDRDNDFLCLLEESDEEYGRDFGIKVLKYYGLSNEEIELAIRKTEINDALWPYEQMLLSQVYDNHNMLLSGLNNIK